MTVAPDPVRIFLGGDVMTGRGIDQILSRPAPPELHEPYVTSALEYVELARRRNGEIPIPADPGYVWGELTEELRRRGPHLRIVNLETAITRDGTPAEKGIHYRMSPENASALSALGVHACVLANNHVLDWQERGLLDTLETLDRLGIERAGAGRDEGDAARPAVLPLANGGRVLLFARGHPSSGVPPEWAAHRHRPGVAFLPGLSGGEADRLVEEVERVRRPGDLVIVSLHWGPNWGYEVGRRERSFAHRLVDEAGVHVVHGHSSHHPRPLEVYRDQPILYGCGDLLNDYEGIRGHEAFRPDLVLGHLLTLDPRAGRLLEGRALPFRVRRFRLERASPEDGRWLAETLSREGRPPGGRFEPEKDGSLILDWT